MILNAACQSKVPSFNLPLLHLTSFETTTTAIFMVLASLVINDSRVLSNYFWIGLYNKDFEDCMPIQSAIFPFATPSFDEFWNSLRYKPSSWKVVMNINHTCTGLNHNDFERRMPIQSAIFQFATPSFDEFWNCLNCVPSLLLDGRCEELWSKSDKPYSSHFNIKNRSKEFSSTKYLSGIWLKYF